MSISQFANYYINKFTILIKLFISIMFHNEIFIEKINEIEDIKRVEEDESISKKDYLFIPSNLTNFCNIETKSALTSKGKENITFFGALGTCDNEDICPYCHNKMQCNNTVSINLKHLPFGGYFTNVSVNRIKYYCPRCHKSTVQSVPFKNENHHITNELYQYTKDLLATGHYTNTEVSELTGLNRNLVKDIDLERLKEKYTIDGKELIKPETQSRYLGIDEFKLHNGYKYATHIIDLETGHILWIQEGKKKQVVYDFMNHVGDEWMKNVIAVACDMNSDFEEAFKDKYSHITIVFDHFHIIKNYNDKVIGAIRKEEQKRLEAEGKIEEAKTLKRSKYILTSSISTLLKKDEEASQNKVISKGSELFHKQEVIRKGGKEEKYKKIMKENKLLFTAELIKEKLNGAYSLNDKVQMLKEIDEIIEMCKSNGNKHFLWFARLLETHYDGIIAHATYKISSGKIEGINNKIKTLRRQAYGYPDDEYFFLKLFDISRTK